MILHCGLRIMRISLMLQQVSKIMFWV